MATFEINLDEFMQLAHKHKFLLPTAQKGKQDCGKQIFLARNSVVICSTNKFETVHALGRVVHHGPGVKLAPEHVDGDTGHIFVSPYNKTRVPKSADPGFYLLSFYIIIFLLFFYLLRPWPKQLYYPTIHALFNTSKTRMVEQ